MNKLTELDKTILLAFLVLTKGSTQKYLDREIIVSKFPRQQRRAVREYLEKLVEKKFLAKHPREEKYQLTEAGLKRSGETLKEGATLWKL